MAPRQHVLIFPAGSEIGLEIYHSLKYSHHLEVYGASGKSDHASLIYPADHYIEDERLYVDQHDFIERLNGYIDQHRIELIYPTHDTIANFLASQQAKIHAKIVTSCAETNHIARFKKETYLHFKSYDFCPVVYDPDSMALPFPVFLKPNDGQGGKGTFCAQNREELAFYLKQSPDLLVTEFLPGEELSVDCFTDFTGALRFVGPRTRERVQMGISFRSTAREATEEIMRIAEAINHAVKLDGAWFFQVKLDRQGRYKLLEFAPRQSSTMGLYRHAGINFALLSFFNAKKMPVEILKNEGFLQLDRCLHNRFKSSLDYSTVYVDLDETLIADGRVHEKVMAFLYQCKNAAISIVLITKHRGDLNQTLEGHGIARSLFSDILHLSDEQDKWAHINPMSSIFIDNYWFDRKQVKEKLGIPVFDVDAVECLLK